MEWTCTSSGVKATCILSATKCSSNMESNTSHMSKSINVSPIALIQFLDWDLKNIPKCQCFLTIYLRIYLPFIYLNTVRLWWCETETAKHIEDHTSIVQTRIEQQYKENHLSSCHYFRNLRPLLSDLPTHVRASAYTHLPQKHAATRSPKFAPFWVA